LRETSFQRANLKGATLVAVDAYRVRFVSADLAGAILDDGRFIEGDFTKTDLSGASLQRADLSRTKFFRASLRGANRTGAKVSGADLLNADLSGARWIDGQRVCGDHSIGQCN
ncbi:MAG: pentapeptide repeat-containing protein, partial [Magnetospirillum sp.]|nr:pentapeptide repeat-containing protein [Magnetospirillum sp.]